MQFNAFYLEIIEIMHQTRMFYTALTKPSMNKPNTYHPLKLYSVLVGKYSSLSSIQGGATTTTKSQVHHQFSAFDQ